MQRGVFIERALRQIYNGQPNDDSEITINLVNTWLNDAIGIAAKQNYKDNISLEGVGSVNNSFFTTFKGLSISQEERGLWKMTLPEIPVGIGTNQGIARVVFKDSNNNISYPGVPLSENQLGYARSMRPIPNKILTYPEGTYYYAITPIIMNGYTATVTMISGGDSSDLDSILNVPPDYFSAMTEYIKAQLLFERKQMPDMQNDGVDN